MKKIPIIFLIFSLILFTAIIKNSAKKIEDEIFLTKENMGILKKEFDNIKLEHDYLSSGQRLIEFKDLYFESDLIKKNIKEIKVIKKSNDNLKIITLNLTK